MKENFEKIINDQNVIIQHLKNEIIDTKLKYKILLDKFSNYFDKIKNTELKTENTEQKEVNTKNKKQKEVNTKTQKKIKK